MYTGLQHVYYRSCQHLHAAVTISTSFQDPVDADVTRSRAGHDYAGNHMGSDGVWIHVAQAQLMAVQLHSADLAMEQGADTVFLHRCMW